MRIIFTRPFTQRGFQEPTRTNHKRCNPETACLPAKQLPRISAKSDSLRSGRIGFPYGGLPSAFPGFASALRRIRIGNTPDERRNRHRNAQFIGHEPWAVSLRSVLGGESQVALEYNSREFHMSEKAAERDASRVNDLLGSGIKSVSVTRKHVADPSKMDIVTHSLAKMMGKRMRTDCTNAEERRASLRKQLFAKDPWQ